ncbi:MAG TPA: LysR family transcriptional regulator [Stellaceae bacterium]|nr:LysR family transcriptional regulator [Stellaceae bacterium]
MDRLTSLAVFARVVDSGGFSAAAQRLGMSPTMVSNHVQALENRLGVRLLNRTTRKVSVTEIGREYYERCIQILAELDEADRIAGSLQLTPRGRLRVHCDTHIVRFIAPLLPGFLADFPDAAIDLRIGERMPDLVEDGFDLAIRPTPPPDSSLIVRRLSSWRHILCCAPQYLESHPAPARPADLTAHNCLRYAYYPYGDEWHFVAADGRPETVRVSGNLVTTSAEALRAVARAGGGLFLAPSFLIADDLRAGAVVRLLPSYRLPEFAINAIYPHRRHLPAKVRVFIDRLAERFAEHRRRMEADSGR